MVSKHSRLDRFISKKLSIKRADIRLLLAQKRIQVDGKTATDTAQQIGQFSLITLDNKILQQQSAHYLMLHKPVGVVCATKDNQHKTVIDLIDDDYPALHIAGRLDLNTSGLVILTNDGKWSRSLSNPLSNIKKKYVVELEHALNEDYIKAFSDGMYFSYENITTKPAGLKITAEKTAIVTLTEGKYHQIKRMFGRFRNPVIKLHRSAIGDLKLCSNLAPGQYRPLTEAEFLALKHQLLY